MPSGGGGGGYTCSCCMLRNKDNLQLDGSKVSSKTSPVRSEKNRERCLNMSTEKDLMPWQFLQMEDK